MSKIFQHYRFVQRLTSATPQWKNGMLMSEYLSCTSCNALVNGTEQRRYYQKPPPRKGLVSKFIANIKEGFSKNEQMQENLKKFREEKAKLDEADSLKDMKDRLSRVNQMKESVSPYLGKIEETVKESSKAVSSTIEKAYKDATESEVFKKGQEVKEDLTKSAKEAASKLSEHGEEIGKTQTYKVASTAAKAVKEDLFDDIAKESRPYERPEHLRKRTLASKVPEEYEADVHTQDVELHKDSKWQQQWKDFRDNNPVVTRLFTLKTKYDESDNVAIRASRVVTEKLSDIFSDVFSQSEQAATIAEITRIDPNFNKDKFVQECEFEIIPTVLEAYLRGDIECLRDWCYEGAFSVLSTDIKQTASLGLVNKSRIIDIRDVELVVAEIMEQGPVLILTFRAQQVLVVEDKKGNIVEGGIDKIENVVYVMSMCRDQSILDHRTAWRVLQIGIQSATPYL